MYNIISSGSAGNAIVYFDRIMVDCGVAYSKVEECINSDTFVLLSHFHEDHLNVQTIRRMQFKHPSIRIGCGDFLKERLNGIRNVHVYEAGKIYDYGKFRVSPVRLYHDCENFGYRIYYGDKKIFHATDTFTLDKITAKNYDGYFIEANYDEDTVFDLIREKTARGEYAHQRGAINSHLSVQQAQNFVLRNGGTSFVPLHQSKEF